jgi:hypothetical protein
MWLPRAVATLRRCEGPRRSLVSASPNDLAYVTHYTNKRREDLPVHEIRPGVQCKDAITFPMHLDFSGMVHPVEPGPSGQRPPSGSSTPVPSEQLEYALTAILLHRGSSASAGHYVSIVKDEQTGKWWKYDDNYVTDMGVHPFKGAKWDAGSGEELEASEKAGPATKAAGRGRGGRGGRKRGGAGGRAGTDALDGDVSTIAAEGAAGLQGHEGVSKKRLATGGRGRGRQRALDDFAGEPVSKKAKASAAGLRGIAVRRGVKEGEAEVMPNTAATVEVEAVDVSESPVQTTVVQVGEAIEAVTAGASGVTACLLPTSQVALCKLPGAWAAAVASWSTFWGHLQACVRTCHAAMLSCCLWHC